MSSTDVWRVITLTQHIDEGRTKGVCGHKPHFLSLGYTCHNTTAGINKRTFQSQSADQGTDDTTYGGTFLKRGLFLLVSTFQHTTEPPWQHTIMQIFHAWLLCKSLAAIQQQLSIIWAPIDTWEELSIGDPWRHNHQTPGKHTSTEANITKPFSNLSAVMDSGVLFFLYLAPLFLPPVSAVLVVLHCFFFPFFVLAHSDAFNASRVMQVWLSVSLDWQPTLKWCIYPALWSEHGKMEISL